MNASDFSSTDEIRSAFSHAMSRMYKDEVPLYGKLMELVSEVNREIIGSDAVLFKKLAQTGEIHRLHNERHGAIRVGTDAELSMLCRLFAVMGMEPAAGVPVHSTAFRAIEDTALNICPFRVFTSLLRVELIYDTELRAIAQHLLCQRKIFTHRALELIEQCEAAGGLSPADASEFVNHSLETFRWHNIATVSLDQYMKLSAQHRLIADVVAFKGPHINHLTPRTMDIDAVQRGMSMKGIVPKAVIEGPPRRKCPILLRQTSFKALEESISFVGQEVGESGSHCARFGEIEQRGAALTPKGRALYDERLSVARNELGEIPNEGNAAEYVRILEEAFQAFPDNYEEMRLLGLAYFRYFPSEKAMEASSNNLQMKSLNQLVDEGWIRFEPIVYEDFLPVSAAGIFQSNLGGDAPSHYSTISNQEEFHSALGRTTLNELELYAGSQTRSLLSCARIMRISEASLML
ncbi:2-oxoadipate dioxygenase/decarboxylase HglS [Pseudomonas tolaasii]